MDDKQSEIRERFLAGWDARVNPREVNGEQSGIGDRQVGIGMAWGTSLGVVMGATLGVAFGDLAFGIGIGLCVGTGIGIAFGVARRSKYTRAAAESAYGADVQAKDA